MFEWLLTTLLSETGEVGDSTEEQQAEAETPVTGQDDQPQVEADAFEQAHASGETSQHQETEENFIDPKDLPDEIKPHWKRMHREYNKRLKDIKDLKSKASTYDRFYNDSAFADQVLQEWANRNGFTLTRSGEVKPTQQSQQQAKAPPELVEHVKSQLSPELQWMAESQANSIWAAQQMMLAPLQRQQQERQLEARNAEYDKYAEELSETAPEWEDKEEEMTDLLHFLNGSEMNHKKYGNKLSLLYNVVTGNAAAISQATKRMVAGVKNKNTNGNRNTTRTSPNLAERIKKANNRDAWDMAVQAALDQEK
jgi:hypothetical protein